MRDSGEENVMLILHVEEKCIEDEVNLGNVFRFVRVQRLRRRFVRRLTLKRLGVNLTHPCGFSKNVSSKESVKP